MGTMKENKVSMEGANYRSAGDDGRSCSNCAQFMPPDQCMLVDGNISPGGVSDLWSKKTNETDVMNQLFGEGNLPDEQY